MDRDGGSSVTVFSMHGVPWKLFISPLVLKPFFETLAKASSESLDKIAVLLDV